MRIGVLGAGTWGTALAILLADNGHELTLWSKFEEETAALKESRRHKNLPGAVLPEKIDFSNSLEDTVTKNELLVLAVPSIYIRSTARAMKGHVRPGQLLVSVAKGIEEGSLYTMADIVEEELPEADVAILSGPSHAEEVARGLPTSIVASARSEESARILQDAFMNERFRVYLNSDRRGIEIGAALKNVIALAAGIADGLGYGDNTKAALITRGIAEIARLGMKLDCKLETFAGLSGIGDLIVTCASMHSRNRRAGILIGEGKSCEEAMKEVGQVVEGVYAAKAGREMAEKYSVSMPIVEKVCEVLFEGKPAREAVTELMQREKRAESRSVSYTLALEE